MKYYLYIIETLSNTYYCGIAKDPEARFLAHREGRGAKYTRTHKPKEIVYLKEFENKSLALREEYKIKKTLSHKEKETLIKKEEEKTKILLAALKIF